jgi:Na+-translocating ferredoxin:NAD+ oxidoreductase RnfC subunit
LFVFPKGIKLEQNKKIPLNRQIERFSSCSRLLVPLVGCMKEEDRLVKEKSRVMPGAALSSPPYGVPAIAPLRGDIAGFCTIEHPLLGEVLCAVLDADKEQPQKAEQTERERKESGGIVAAAGAAGILDEFDGLPLYKKLKNYRRSQKDILVCCAADDDPFTAGAAAVLREHAEEVLDGLTLAAKFCGTAETRILVENRYEQAALHKKFPQIKCCLAGKRYPARGLLKRKLYSGGKTSGFLGVQACLALSRAVRRGEPQMSTVITVTGDCIDIPRNLRVLLGTPVCEVLEYCGMEHTPEAVFFGSAITGRPAADRDTPVSANTRCVIAVKKLPRRRQYACIGCGRCVSACPRGILPWSIREQLSHENVDIMKLVNVQNCIACGACSMACPSGIDLADLVLQASSLKKSGDLK